MKDDLLKFSFVKDERFGPVWCFVIENVLSEAAELAGMDKIRFTARERIGYSASRLLHQSSKQNPSVLPRVGKSE